MSNPAASTVDPSLKSNAAPLLEGSGGAAGLVSSKIDALAAGLPGDPSAENMVNQSSRNMGFEAAMRAAAEFKESHENDEPNMLQRQKAMQMANAFERMRPQEQPYNEADAMYLTFKKMVEGILHILKKIFGQGNEGLSNGFSGYGAEYDAFMQKMEKSMKQFEDHTKDMKREEELAKDDASGPAGPGSTMAPGKKG
jgi:hypothetical protein